MSQFKLPIFLLGNSQSVLLLYSSYKPIIRLEFPSRQALKLDSLQFQRFSNISEQSCKRPEFENISPNPAQ